MAIYKVSLTEPAENDLRDIAKYISSQFSAPITALNMIQAIKKAIAKLETMPLAYPLVRDDRLAALGYRFIPVNNYIVFYIASEKEKSVDVDRTVFHLCQCTDKC